MIDDKWIKTAAERAAALLADKIENKNLVLLDENQVWLEESLCEKGFCFVSPDDAVAGSVGAVIAGNAFGGPGGEDKIRRVAELSERFCCPILVTEGNAGNLPLVLSALSNGKTYPELRALCGEPSFTERQLEEIMCGVWFERTADSDFPLESFEICGTVFESPGTQLAKVIKNAAQKFEHCAQTAGFVRLYSKTQSLTAIKEDENSEFPAPFLSVILRTQGTRVDALREALLCLSAQSDMDFEVLLICHNASSPNEKNVLRLIDDLPASFRKRVRYYALNQGTRSAPLNFGAKLARGRYISFFDDDDILFADWVAAFKRADKKAPGAILHSYGMNQDWSVSASENAQNLRAVGRANPLYCRDFEWLTQLRENFCPFMSLAFPSYLFTEMGFSFDESLLVMEDWDFLLRTASFCGVQDEPSVTAVYRIWKDSEDSSHSLHDTDFWQTAYVRIRQKFTDIPLIVNGESLIKQLKSQSQSQSVMDVKLYLDDGNSWSERNTMECEREQYVGNFYFRYDGLSQKQKSRQLRWDPISDSCIYIKELSVSLEDANGGRVELDNRDIFSNGIRYKKGWLLFSDDAQMYFMLPADFVPESCVISGESSIKIPRAQSKFFRGYYNAIVPVKNKLLPLWFSLRRRFSK